MMQNPDYTKNTLYTAPDRKTLSAVERAALHVAEVHHAKDHRKKADGIQLAGITHLYLTHRLLKAFDVSDEKVLAASFVHDVIEDNEYWKRLKLPFEERANRVMWDLIRQLLTEKGMDREIAAADIPRDIMDIAQEVTRMAYHLSNPEHMPEGKRLYQVDKLDPRHPDALSGEECLIKLADQGASILCDIMTPAAKKDRGLAYAAKGWNIGKAAASSSEEGRFVSPIHEGLYRFIQLATKHLRQIVIHSDAEEAALSRIEFDSQSLTAMVEKAKRLENRPSMSPRRTKEYYIDQELPEGTPGIVQIRLDSRQRVDSVLVCNNPDGNKDLPVTRLINSIEGDTHHHGVVSAITPPSPANIRRLKFAEPVDKARFRDIAVAAGLLPSSFRFTRPNKWNSGSHAGMGQG